MHAYRPVILLVLAGAILGGAPSSTWAAAPSQAMVAATHPPVGPQSTTSDGTRVSVRVLPAPTPTQTYPPPPTPTQPPTHLPPTHLPTAGGSHGGGLPKTGTNSSGLFELGVGALSVGGLLVWLASAAFRRRREDTL